MNEPFLQAWYQAYLDLPQRVASLRQKKMTLGKIPLMIVTLNSEQPWPSYKEQFKDALITIADFWR